MWTSSRYFLLMATALTNIILVCGAEASVEEVGVMVGQVVEHHLTGCHLGLMTTAPNSLVFSAVRR